MSERGVFALDRGFFDHPAFADETFTEREAWAWMIAQAAWRKHKRRVAGIIVMLERGQLVGSVRHLAERWKWHPSKVVRFQERLKKQNMITTATETGVTVITLCNYGRYQRVGLPTDTPSEHQTGTAPIQDRNKEEEALKHLNILSQSGADAPSASDAFDRFKEAYPKREAQHHWQEAEGAFSKLVAAGADPELIIAAARSYAENERKKNNVGTRFIMGVVRWLREGHWRDHGAEQVAPFPVIRSGMAEFDAWRKHYERSGKVPFTFQRALTDPSVAVTVPTLWPDAAEHAA